MTLKTNYSKDELLNLLMSNTTIGSANLGAGPWAIIRIFTGAIKTLFYGSIREDDFELTSHFWIIPYYASIEGQIKEAENHTIVELQNVFLTIPLFLYTLMTIAAISFSIFFYKITDDYSVFGIIGSFLLLSFLTIRLIYLKQRKKLTKRFIDITNANKL